MSVMGAENIPKSNDGYIMVSNHTHYSDIPILAGIFKNSIGFLAKKELSEKALLKFWMDTTGIIRIDRERPRASTIKLVKECLETKGWKVGIFIEGTRSRIKGKLGKPNNGAAYIAKLTKKPILPIGINYGEDKKVTINIGKPYNLDYEKELEDSSWQCLEKISKLSGLSLPEKNVPEKVTI